MAKKSLNGVLHHVRLLAAVQTDRAKSDPELLERFVQHNDEAAFTVLIERHGAMVLGVCQRALQHAQDAEDACQATFLVFARKAGAIRKTTSLGSWLHGIACRISANLKRQKARRHKRELHAVAPAQSDAVHWHEVQMALDEELQQLPDRYRAPLLLCYWEGKTRDEAAGQLGLSIGKLHGLLERGRSLLRDRLTQRGLTLSAALCASLVASGTASATLAPTMVVSVTTAALLLAAGKSLSSDLVTSQALILTKEVLSNMFYAKLKIATASILCLGMAAALIGGSFAATGSAQDSPRTTKTIQPPAKQSETDEAFIRRISKDLRGVEPTPAEVHFFVANKDAGKRQKLIDLFIQERQVKRAALFIQEHQAKNAADVQIARDEHERALVALARLVQANAKPPMNEPYEAQRQLLEAELRRLEAELEALKRIKPDAGKKDKVTDSYRAVTNEYLRLRVRLVGDTNVIALQDAFLKSLVKAGEEKKSVPAAIQDYRDSLLKYLQEHPKAGDVPDAMLQIELTYRAQGKTVEADAWNAKLKKEHPDSPAAKTRVGALEPAPRFRVTESQLLAEDLEVYFMMGVPKTEPTPAK